MQLSYLTLYLYQVLNVQFFPFLEHFAVGHSLWLPSQVVVANNPIKGIQCIQSQISHRDLVVKISVHSIGVLGRFLNTRGGRNTACYFIVKQLQKRFGLCISLFMQSRKFFVYRSKLEFKDLCQIQLYNNIFLKIIYKIRSYLD